ncbi:TetR/AcrR family transcriptional regulator [Enterococcus faecalis]|uniref:TetR/AcrR family transcriptional regulator n=1 Tax=Enterococcus faecalis TaxID=1351 RepID=UPI0022EFFC48|nr:TetR/AcrR family transcriptional regulator [Enterococcus faecalis]MCV6006160.1 TetR/AcrR family transcriptional regulator [Enterococcus faecalis]
MMAKKTDLRVQRTRKMIIEAFFKLVETKGYEAVTIQDIADEAMINRATFYAHFKDKQHLYDAIFTFTLSAFTAILDSQQLVNGNRVRVKHIEELLTQLYINIQENKSFFLTIMDNNFNEHFRKRLAEIIEEKYATIFSQLRITENDIDVPIDFVIEYMTSIFIGTLHWWITSETDMTPNHLAQLVIKLVGNGYLTVLGIELEK